jgi:hypothetical protein
MFIENQNRKKNQSCRRQQSKPKMAGDKEKKKGNGGTQR